MNDDGFIDWRKPLFDEKGASVSIHAIIDQHDYMHDRLNDELIDKLIDTAVEIQVWFTNPDRREGLPYVHSFNSWGQSIDVEEGITDSEIQVPNEVTNYDVSMEPEEGDELWGLM